MEIVLKICHYSVQIEILYDKITVKQDTNDANVTVRPCTNVIVFGTPIWNVQRLHEAIVLLLCSSTSLMICRQLLPRPKSTKDLMDVRTSLWIERHKIIDRIWTTRTSVSTLKGTLKTEAPTEALNWLKAIIDPSVISKPKDIVPKIHDLLFILFRIIMVKVSWLK